MYWCLLWKSLKLQPLSLVWTARSRTPRLCCNVKHSSDLTPYRTLWFVEEVVIFKLCVSLLWNSSSTHSILLVRVPSKPISHSNGYHMHIVSTTPHPGDEHVTATLQNAGTTLNQLSTSISGNTSTPTPATCTVDLHNLGIPLPAHEPTDRSSPYEGHRVDLDPLVYLANQNIVDCRICTINEHCVKQFPATHCL